MREQQREKKIVKGEKKQKDEEKSGSSTCRSAYAYAVSRVSNPGEGLTRGRSGRARCSHQCVREFLMDGTKKKIGRKNLLPPLIGQRTKKRFIAIRIKSNFELFFLSDFTTISNVHHFPFAQWIRIWITRLPIIILARCKKKNLEPVFTLIGRSVDTIVNGDRTNHRVLSVSIVINAQETRWSPLHAWTTMKPL